MVAEILYKTEENSAVLKGRANASSIVGVARRTSFLFFERSPGPDARRARGFVQGKKTLLLATPTILLVASVTILASQFHFDEGQMVAQYLMLTWTPPQNVLQGNNSQLSPTQRILQKVAKSQALLKESYSFLVEAAKICLTQPVSDAVVERGVSAIQRVKTRLRNRLKNDMLSAFLYEWFSSRD